MTRTNNPTQFVRSSVSVAKLTWGGIRRPWWIFWVAYGCCQWRGTGGDLSLGDGTEEAAWGVEWSRVGSVNGFNRGRDSPVNLLLWWSFGILVPRNLSRKIWIPKKSAFGFKNSGLQQFRCGLLQIRFSIATILASHNFRFVVLWFCWCHSYRPTTSSSSWIIPHYGILLVVVGGRWAIRHRVSQLRFPFKNIFKGSFRLPPLKISDWSWLEE